MVRDRKAGGRTPFPLVEGDDDYSGKDLIALSLQDSKSLSHAFLNGVTLSDCEFRRCSLDQCEFGEAHVDATLFSNCILAGTDFVRAIFTDVDFEDCDFTEGEWRESNFQQSRFVRCNFTRATVNLCIFRGCDFDAMSAEGLDHKAVNYNVFSQCVFETGICGEVVLSRNYGLRSGKPSLAIAPQAGGISLEQVCLLSSTRRVLSIEVVTGIENECRHFHGRMRRLRLEFISNIVRTLASEGWISAASLIYIEFIISGLAATSSDESEVQSVLSAYAAVRGALLACVDAALATSDIAAEEVESLSIRYESRLSQLEGEMLAESVGLLASGRDRVSLSSIEIGSTIFNFDLTAAVYTSTAVVAALNLLLSQMRTSIKLLRALKAELAKGKTPVKKGRSLPSAKRQTAAHLLLAKEPSQLAVLRQIVHKNGLKMVELDDKADITIQLREDGRTEKVG